MDGVYILVLDRGFVVIGTIEPHPTLSYHWLCRGRTVRRWGTTKGLAELCDGPTKETVLDAEAERIIPWRSVIEMLKAEEKRWEKSLSK